MASELPPVIPRIPEPKDLGSDPEPPGVRFQRLMRPRSAQRVLMPPPRRPAVRGHRPPHIGMQRGRHR